MTEATPEPLPPPTAAHRATARRLRAQHLPDEQQQICAWCLKPWPCPDIRWCDSIDRRAQLDRDGPA